MSTTLIVFTALCMFGALGSGLAALFARDQLAAWRGVLGVLDAPGAEHVDVTVEGALPGGAPASAPAAPLTAPASERECGWFAVWATQLLERPVNQEGERGHVALFERSEHELVLRAGGRRLRVAPELVWPQPGEDQPNFMADDQRLPFGAAPAHRALAFWPEHHSWAAFQAGNARVVSRSPPVIGEIRLELGAAYEAVGVVRRGADGVERLTALPGGGVLLLQPCGEVEALARKRERAARRMVRGRWRSAGLCAAGFVIGLIAAAATAG